MWQVAGMLEGVVPSWPSLPVMQLYKNPLQDATYDPCNPICNLKKDDLQIWWISLNFKQFYVSRIRMENNNRNFRRAKRNQQFSRCFLLSQLRYVINDTISIGSLEVNQTFGGVGVGTDWWVPNQSKTVPRDSFGLGKGESFEEYGEVYNDC